MCRAIRTLADAAGDQRRSAPRRSSSSGRSPARQARRRPTRRSSPRCGRGRRGRREALRWVTSAPPRTATSITRMIKRSRIRFGKVPRRTPMDPIPNSGLPPRPDILRSTRSPSRFPPSPSKSSWRRCARFESRGAGEGPRIETVEREFPGARAGFRAGQGPGRRICHSDVLVKDGLWPGLQYPRVPGHEVIGHLDAVGGASPGKPGATASASAGTAATAAVRRPPPRRLLRLFAELALITGISFDGGYADYIVAPPWRSR